MSGCGTVAAYTAHQRRGEKPCAECVAAKAEYDKRRRAERKRERLATQEAKPCQCGCGRMADPGVKCIRGHRARTIMPIEERFWAKVDKTGECWIWTAKRDRHGYGRFARGPKCAGFVGAHRFAYELEVGPIPDGLVIDHLCRNRACVRPDHLEPVTAEENVRRGWLARRPALKTHCIHGHQYTPENTKIRPNGRRKCRACDREQAMAAYYKRKGVVL